MNLKLFASIAAAIATTFSTFAHAADTAIVEFPPFTETNEQREARLAWWREARFGCFVHWGVYSQLGNEWKGKRGQGYGEHIQRALRIKQADYKRDAVDLFNPVKFNADEWMSLVHRAGMRYFIITAKHHDGFAMYDSAVSDYNIVKATPWKRDPMKDLKSAAIKQGIRFGFYYSHAFDWGEEHGAGNDWEWKNPGGDKLINGSDWWLKMPEKVIEVREKYVFKKSIPQIQELVKLYDPDIMWFDTPHKLPPEDNNSILLATRASKPGVVINGRLIYGKGDYQNTGDKAVEFVMRNDDWEAIPTTNESYGWNPLDNSHKSPQTLIRVLAKAVAHNGNMLLNVGPTRDGNIDPKDVAILEGIGKWMDVNEPSIRGCGASVLPIQPWGVTTAKGNTVFLHVFDWPTKPLVVGGLQSIPSAAYLLSDKNKTALKVSRMNPTDLTIEVPASAPDAGSSVIVLEFTDKPVAGGVRLLSSDQPANRLIAFDATLHNLDKTGKEAGFGYGDGKVNNYYVSKWTSTDQWIAWEVRLNEPMTVNVEFRYLKSPGSGDYSLSCRDLSFKKSITGDPKDRSVVKEQAGTITLPAGTHTFELRASKIEGGELLKPLELLLTPAK